MNSQLYSEVYHKLETAKYEGRIEDGDLTGELIEDYVADTAGYHDEQSGFVDNWSDLDELAKVVNALITHYYPGWKPEDEETGS